MGLVMRIDCRDGALKFVEHLGLEESEVKLDSTDDSDVFIVTGGRFIGEPLRFRGDENGTVTGFNVAGFPGRKLVNQTARLAAGEASKSLEVPCWHRKRLRPVACPRSFLDSSVAALPQNDIVVSIFILTA